MPLFSVIIPTYNHCDTIIWSIRSVQEQTIQDFEIIVAGDGVPDRTREIMQKECEADKRIRFIDNPKGEAKGEVHRHNAVLASEGKYIAYIADDDVWHKLHLAHLQKGLSEADMCNTLHTCVYPDGKSAILPGDIANEYNRKTLNLLKFNFFGPTCVGHTKTSYLSLPKGWAPAPKGMWTDLYMWRQWFAQLNMRFKTIPEVSTVHIDSPGRDTMTIEERTIESKKWLKKIRDDVFFEAFTKKLFQNLALNEGTYQYHSGRLDRENRKLKGLLEKHQVS